jgi:hypothetical protein
MKVDAAHAQAEHEMPTHFIGCDLHHLGGPRLREDAIADRNGEIFTIADGARMRIEIRHARRRRQCGRKRQCGENERSY